MFGDAAGAAAWQALAIVQRDLARGAPAPGEAGAGSKAEPEPEAEAAEAAVRGRRSRSAAPPRAREPVSVLLVEDNATKSLIISLLEDNATHGHVLVARRMLEAAGHKVTVAGNGLEGLRAYAADPAAFGLVLMDQEMPLVRPMRIKDKRS
eukprot:tig00020660_g12563.t1